MWRMTRSPRALIAPGVISGIPTPDKTHSCWGISYRERLAPSIRRVKVEYEANVENMSWTFAQYGHELDEISVLCLNFASVSQNVSQPSYRKTSALKLESSGEINTNKHNKNAHIYLVLFQIGFCILCYQVSSGFRISSSHDVFSARWIPFQESRD